MQDIKKLLYQIKKRHGSPIDFYKITNEKINVETGKKIVLRTKYPIKKAVFLKQFRDFRNAIIRNIIAPQSALLEIIDAELLLDVKDFPKNFKIELTDHVLIKHKLYEIKEIYQIDEQSYYLVLKEYKGNIPHESFNRNIIDKLTLIHILKARHEILWTQVIVDQFFINDRLDINFILYNRLITDYINFDYLLFPVTLNNKIYIGLKNNLFLTDSEINNIVRNRNLIDTIIVNDYVIRDQPINQSVISHIDIDQFINYILT